MYIESKKDLLKRALVIYGEFRPTTDNGGMYTILTTYNLSIETITDVFRLAT